MSKQNCTLIIKAEVEQKSLAMYRRVSRELLNPLYSMIFFENNTVTFIQTNYRFNRQVLREYHTRISIIILTIV